MRDMRETQSVQHQVIDHLREESYTFVSYDTLDNIFPAPVLNDLAIRKEVDYQENLKSSLGMKLVEYVDIWKELGKR